MKKMITKMSTFKSVVISLSVLVAVVALADEPVVVQGHISQGKADGSTTEVPCSVSFLAGSISIKNGDQTSRRCDPSQEDPTCSLSREDSITFATILDSSLVYACQINTSDIPQI